MKRLIPISLFFFLFIPLATAQTTYTESSMTTCNDDVCTKTLYSGTQFIQEDKEWITIDKAKSLKDVWDVKTIKDDKKYIMRLDEYNYTDARVCLKVLATEIGKKIPLRYCNASKTNVISLQENCKELVNPTFLSTGETCYTVRMKESLLGYNFTFGVASTTIILQDANTETLEDTYINQSDPTSNYGSIDRMYMNVTGANGLKSFIKFNISQIPLNVTVTSAVFKGTGATDINSRCYHFYHVPNQTWEEDKITWNNNPMDNGTYTSLGDNGGCGSNLGNWFQQSFTITDTFNDSYYNGYSNFTIVINQTDTYNPIINHYTFGSKEYSTASSRPILEITYYLGKATWYNNQSFLVSEYNPSNITYFNTTWNTSNTSLINISWVYIEGNWSGSKANYTMSNATYGNDIFNYSEILPAGHFYWKSWANTSEDGWNVTDTWLFTIAQNTSNPTRLNSSGGGSKWQDQNFSTESDETVTLLSYLTYSNSGTAQLWVNGLNYANPDSRTWGVGSYNITLNTTGNANYTSNTTGVTFVMTITTPTGTGGGDNGGGGGGGGDMWSIITSDDCNVTLRPRLGFSGSAKPGEHIAPFTLTINNKNISQRFTVSLLGDIEEYCTIDYKMDFDIPPWGSDTYTIKCIAPENTTMGNVVIESSLGCVHGIPITVSPSSGIFSELSNIVKLFVSGDVWGAMTSFWEMLNTSYIIPIWAWLIIALIIIAIILSL